MCERERERKKNILENVTKKKDPKKKKKYIENRLAQI